MVWNNGGCQYPNGGYGWQNTQYPPQGHFLKNGSISNSSQFRDFAVRYYGYNHYYNALGYGDKAAQVKMGGLTSQNAVIQVISPELIQGSMTMQGVKFQYSNNTNATYYTIYSNNPYTYEIGELEVIGDISKAVTLQYKLYYKRNANREQNTVIISGYLRRGIDFY